MFSDYKNARSNIDSNLRQQAANFALRIDSWLKNISQIGQLYLNQYDIGALNNDELQRMLGRLYMSFDGYDNLLLVTPQ